MERSTWYSMLAADDLLREIYRDAKSQQDWRVVAHVQASRARLSAVMALYGPQFADLHDSSQLQLVEDQAGRRHDADPAA